MTVYIALLRGLNVGGKNKVKMAELRELLTQLGLGKAQTYIQSGNALFESEEGEAELRGRLEAAFEARFGFSSVVVLRTAEELERIAAGCPFSGQEIAEAEAASDAESLYVALLPGAPSAEKAERLAPYRSAAEDYRIVGRDVYLLFKESIRDSKLAQNLHKLDVPSTVRNWKTLSKLIGLAREMRA